MNNSCKIISDDDNTCIKTLNTLMTAQLVDRHCKEQVPVS